MGGISLDRIDKAFGTTRVLNGVSPIIAARAAGFQ